MYSVPYQKQTFESMSALSNGIKITRVEANSYSKKTSVYIL